MRVVLLLHSLLIPLLFLCPLSEAGFPTFSYIGESSHAPVPLRKLPPHIDEHKWTLENVTRLADATDEATIAFFVQISESSLPLTPRLLARIHHPGNFYALHFDKKIPPHRVVSIASDIKNDPRYSNVFIMPREPVTYRGVTMVLNNMGAMSHLLDMGDWDYFINLSGSDYPLVAPEVPRKILAMPHVRERRSNFFIVSPKEQWSETMHYRFERIAVDTALGMSQKPEDSSLVVLDQTTPLFSKINYEFVKGEGWLILTREACNFMISSSYARKMLLSMAFSQDASEHFYVSLFWNHPDFNKTIVPHSLRTVYWRINGKNSGQHPYTIDQVREPDGSYTVWKWLRTSPHWFARKFSVPDSEVMDWIDNEMSGVGENVNEAAVEESKNRMEGHLHWLYGMMQHGGENRR